MSASHMKPAPKQVQDAAAAANQAHAHYYPPPLADGLPPPVEPAPSGPGNPPILYGYGSPPQPGEPGHPGFPPGKGPGAQPPAASAPAAPPAAEPPAAPTPPAAPAQPPATPPQPEPEDTWEQRYRALQGKYNAEVPALREQVNGLETVLSVMQEPMGLPSVPTIGDQAAHDAALAKLTEEFGPDVVETIVAEGMRRIQPQFQALQDNVAAYNKRLEEARIEQAQTARELMYKHMHDTVPGWEQVNQSNEFKAWLNQVDILAGVPRGQLLKNAYDANDGPRLAAFFLTFSQEQTIQGAHAQPPTGLPPAPPATPRPGLETFAAPGRGAPPAPAPTSAPQGQIWTQAEIKAFYRDKQRGVFRGRDKEARDIEMEIFAAGREGRVRG